MKRIQLKRVIGAALIGAVLFCFSGCYSDPGEPYDLEEATELVKQTETCVYELLYTNIGEEESLVQFDKTYRSYSRSLFRTFTDMGHFNEDGSFTITEDDWFYPLIFHEGFEVVSAYVQPCPGGEQLTVTEQYTGGDKPLLDGFKRVTVYEKTAQGEWKFREFGGNVGIYKEGLTWDYLPLGDDLPQTTEENG